MLSKHGRKATKVIDGAALKIRQIVMKIDILLRAKTATTTTHQKKIVCSTFSCWKKVRWALKLSFFLLTADLGQFTILNTKMNVSFILSDRLLVYSVELRRKMELKTWAFFNSDSSLSMDDTFIQKK